MADRRWYGRQSKHSARRQASISGLGAAHNEEAPMSEEERLAHYRLKERLGAGAMGEVWLREGTRLPRLVALKRLASAAAGDGEASARLVREARVASTLTHPNVAVVYDVGEADPERAQAAYIAMEYVRGRTLAERLREGPIGT